MTINRAFLVLAILGLLLLVGCRTTKSRTSHPSFPCSDREYAEIVLRAISTQARSGHGSIEAAAEPLKPELWKFLAEWRTIAPDRTGVNIILGGEESHPKVEELFWNGYRIAQGFQRPIEHTVLLGVERGPDHIVVTLGRTSFSVYSKRSIQYEGQVFD